MKKMAAKGYLIDVMFLAPPFLVTGSATKLTIVGVFTGGGRGVEKFLLKCGWEPCFHIFEFFRFMIRL